MVTTPKPSVFVQRATPPPRGSAVFQQAKMQKPVEHIALGDKPHNPRAALGHPSVQR